MKGSAADILVKYLENEGVEYIFGIPGEENLDVMDSLIDSKIQFRRCITLCTSFLQMKIVYCGGDTPYNTK